MLAVLCDFKGRPANEVLREILTRLREMTAESPKRFREYLRMLEVLSSNRDLEGPLHEEELMLRIELNKLPSYNIGLERGLEQGMERGNEGHFFHSHCA